MGHYGDRRSTPEQLHRAELAGKIRALDGEFTPRSLAARYDVELAFMMEFLNDLRNKRFVACVPAIGGYLKPDTTLISTKPASVRDADRGWASMFGRDSYQVKSNCSRCGKLIPGKGRHRKAARGHSKEECDLAMVALLHSV